jgi:benzodiazapine receptor
MTRRRRHPTASRQIFKPMSTRSLTSQSLGLAGWLLITFAAAGIGALASVDAAVFYARLSKPAWAPPGWVFGPVWSVLYALMGISAWLIAATAAAFWRASRTAALLLLPYLLWVAFASCLTWTIWQSNMGLL